MKRAGILSATLVAQEQDVHEDICSVARAPSIFIFVR